MSDPFDISIDDLQTIPEDKSPFRDEPTEKEIKDAAPKVKSKPDTELIIKALTKTYVGVGVGVGFFSPMDSMAIVSNAEDLAESWRTLLDNDPKMRRIMKKFTESSGWGSVVAAHGLVATQIMKNHEVNFGHLIKPKAKERNVPDS